MPPVPPRSEADGEALLAAARDAAHLAYAPYSGFLVGAAVRGLSGRVFTAANVENASYGLSLCAEANAITAAVVAGARPIDRVAVVGWPEGEPDVGSMANPCGRCRQIIAEFADPSLLVHVADRRDTERLTIPLAELLPHPFRLRTP
jgi:cytidine deaminase